VRRGFAVFTLLMGLLAPTASASLQAVADEPADRIYVLTTGAAGHPAPALSRPDGTPVPPLALVNESGNMSTYASAPLPAGVYRVLAGNESVLVALGSDSAIAAVEQLARSVGNLTARLRALEANSTATQRSQAAAIEVLGDNVSALVENVTLARSDARASRVAVENIHIPTDLPRRSDVSDAVKTTGKEFREAQSLLLYPLAGVALLVIAEGVGLALLIRRPRAASADALVANIETMARAETTREATSRTAPWTFGYVDSDPPLPAPFQTTPPTPARSQETDEPRLPLPGVSGLVPSPTASEGGRGDGSRETTAAPSGSTAPMVQPEASDPGGRGVSPSLLNVRHVEVPA